MKKIDRALVWFRRDLRSFDHAALHHALASAAQVFCVFIFDKDILDPLREHGTLDRRVAFIHASLIELDAELRRHGGGLQVWHARAAEAIPQIARELDVDAVFCNHDYEPSAAARDRAVADALAKDGRQFFSFKDQVIFEKDEVLSLSDKPFSVFTPYKNAWLKKFQTPAGGLDSARIPHFGCTPKKSQLALPSTAPAMPTLGELGFDDVDFNELHIPTGMSGGQQLLDDFLPRLSRYRDTRDFPSVKGPSYLSVHLRFGTVSVRALATSIS